jgi:sigma-E factor negative regulatory protein RseB
VQVRDAEGAVEIVAADGAAVVDDGRRTYLHERLGWTGALIEPAAGPLPDPTRHWDLATGAPTTVAGRPAIVVVASRADGTPAQRLYVDDATGLVLGREVLGADGHVQRAVRFLTVDIGAPVTTVTAPKGVRSGTAEKLTSVPDGYHAPQSLGGYELITRSRHPDGVLLFYSDGLFTASVFEQKGELDWGALPRGGSDTRVADTRSRQYREPSGDVLVWERNGVVYTCVSDAPSDAVANMVDDLAAADRNTVQSVVDFVLGPFGWN